ncbi:MAG: carboxyltransferase domain-containing protein [Acidobacteriota bacterium]|nr:carboxyltransferase domain-containing protein [Acidobacteriota bacterium]
MPARGHPRGRRPGPRRAARPRRRPGRGGAVRVLSAAEVSPLGDAAVLVDLRDMEAAWRLADLVHEARRAAALAVEEAVVGLGTLTVVFDPLAVDGAELAAALGDLARRVLSGAARARPGGAGAVGGEAPFEIPVWFDGPDLEEVAAGLGRSPAWVVDELCASALRVAFLGFSPGFAYLGGLSPVLAGLGRRHRPRPEVPPGSVALAGGFAAVYPQATPGGWQLVGRTGASLFDPHRPPHAVLSPGRAVRIVRARDEPAPPPAPPRPVLRVGRGPSLVVEAAGACTLVEDGGRRGVAGLGVPRAGAFDAVALALANRLVGNGGGEAVLEVTGRGPALRAGGGPVQLAVVGDPGRPGAVDVRVDGRPVPEATVVSVGPGQAVEVPSAGVALRAVVAVGGGLEVPALFGSKSADLLSGLGQGPLRAGDELAVGQAGRPRGRIRFAGEAGGDVVRLRVVAGPEAGPLGVPAGEWTVAPESNRVGVRLTGGVAPAGGITDVVSRGMVAGAVQAPPGGELVVLGPDHATVGGYPVVAVVARADLHRLAHLAPGRRVCFEPVELAEARRALGALDDAVASAVSGWFPTVAG